MTEPGQQRLDALVVFRLAGGADGAHRPAAETVQGGDDLVTPRFAVEAGQLDRRLDRLGAGVAEEALAPPPRPLAERLGELSLSLGVPRVRDVDEPPNL